MDQTTQIIQSINSLLWGMYGLIPLLVGTGLYFTFKLRFVQIKRFVMAARHVFGGITLFADQIQGILARIRNEDWRTAEVPGTIRREDVVPAYLERVLSDVRLERSMRIAIDAGNGVAGPVAARLFKSLGCEVTELFTDVDGTFPNHHPDPSKPANLEDLKKAVLEDGIELGLAFDGDGDRLGVVTKSGEIIYPDRQMMLFAKDILAHHPGAQIVYDVKCTRRLVPWIETCGGVPTISCTGHSLVKAKLRETGAPFAGEMSGHLFFNDGRWPGFDDGVYAGARILEILSREADPSAALEALPSAVNTPELQIRMAEGENKAFIARLQKEAQQKAAEEKKAQQGFSVDPLDFHLPHEEPPGQRPARSSNTTPVVVLRLEGDTPEALERIKKTFAEVLLKVEPSLELPF